MASFTMTKEQLATATLDAIKARAIELESPLSDVDAASLSTMMSTVDVGEITEEKFNSTMGQLKIIPKEQFDGMLMMAKMMSKSSVDVMAEQMAAAIGGAGDAAAAAAPPPPVPSRNKKEGEAKNEMTTTTKSSSRSSSSPSSNTKALFLHFDVASQGTLFNTWSSSDTPTEGSFASFIPLKAPPGWKVSRNGGRTEVCQKKFFFLLSPY